MFAERFRVERNFSSAALCLNFPATKPIPRRKFCEPFLVASQILRSMRSMCPNTRRAPLLPFRRYEFFPLFVVPRIYSGRKYLFYEALA